MQKSLKFFVFSCCLLFILPRAFTNPLGAGLDYSWQLALQMAFERGMIFGSEFIFTYGPLGFLATRLPLASTAYWLLLYDLLIALNLLLTLTLIARRIQSSCDLVLCAGAFLVFGIALYYLEAPIILLGFVQCYVIELLETKRPLLLFFLVFDALIVFLIKLNTGFVALLLCGVLALFLLFQKRWGETLLLLLLLTAGVLASTLLLPIDLVSYLITSFHIADSYNDAMYLWQADKEWLLCAALIPIVLFIGTILWSVQSIFEKKQTLLVTGISLGVLFILFKSAFVRADEHVYVFFDYVLIPIGLSALYWPATLRKRARFMVGTTLLVSVYVAQDRFGVALLSQKIARAEAYITEAKNVLRVSNAQAAIPERAKLPLEITEEIGNATVDVIPEEISFIYYNHLNYRPRPVIQSYAAYDAYLDHKNASFFLSERAPQYLIVSWGCVDWRYCLFDETATKFALLERYEFRKSFGPYALLKLRGQALNLDFEKETEGQACIGQWVKISQNGSFLELKPDLHYSLWGQLRRFFFRPAPLEIEFRVAAQTTRRFRVIVPLMQSGMIMNPYVATSEDFDKFLKQQFDQLPRIEGFRLRTSDKRGFQKCFRYSSRGLLNSS